MFSSKVFGLSREIFGGLAGYSFLCDLDVVLLGG